MSGPHPRAPRAPCPSLRRHLCLGGDDGAVAEDALDPCVRSAGASGPHVCELTDRVAQHPRPRAPRGRHRAFPGPGGHAPGRAAPPGGTELGRLPGTCPVSGGRGGAVGKIPEADSTDTGPRSRLHPTRAQ